jgi:hypothetical protein
MRLEGVMGCSVHGRAFPLAFGRAFTFGRSRDTDYRLPDAHMGRQHFQVAWLGCGLLVRPLHNRRAMFLNCSLIPWGEWTRMQPGDFLLASEARLRVVAAPQRVSYSVLPMIRSIREGGDHASLPILADALEEEGFDSPEILQHCRETEHDACCWVLGLPWGPGQAAGNCEAIR